jgi:hypothetical protein
MEMEINVEEIWIIALKILKSDCVVFLYKINNEIEVIRMMKDCDVGMSGNYSRKIERS